MMTPDQLASRHSLGAHYVWLRGEGTACEKNYVFRCTGIRVTTGEGEGVQLTGEWWGFDRWDRPTMSCFPAYTDEWNTVTEPLRLWRGEVPWTPATHEYYTCRCCEEELPIKPGRACFTPCCEDEWYTASRIKRGGQHDSECVCSDCKTDFHKGATPPWRGPPMETRTVVERVSCDYQITEDLIERGNIGCADPEWWELPGIYLRSAIEWLKEDIPYRRNLIVAWWRRPKKSS